jgi:SAM-dependent methyltransferase
VDDRQPDRRRRRAFLLGTAAPKVASTLAEAEKEIIVTADTDHENVYDSPQFKDLDIGAIMRSGHPDIAQGDEYIVAAVAELKQRLGRRLRIIDVGSGSGDLSLLIADKLPDCTVIANDIAEKPLEQARRKLAQFSHASVERQPFEEWNGTADVVISWGSHHHLSHDYLEHVRKALAPDGLFIVGDEFCPEYLTEADQRRLAEADEIIIADGYIFDSGRDAAEYASTGTPPPWTVGLELRRRKALWTWYKFVGDYAVERDAWPVLITELAIARDDLITEFTGEHKTSPYLLERELELNGFAILDKTLVGERELSLRSFVIYCCQP